MRVFASTCVALLVVAGPLQAQSRYSLELRGGAAIPTADLGDAALNTGGGMGLNAAVRFLPHALVYAGWDWFRLTTKEPLAGADFDVENTGYAFGLQFQHPLVNTIDGWFRAGAIYNHIELENVDGDVIADSGHELGWEAGGGVSVPISERFAITPGFRYRTFSTDLELNGARIPVDMSYLAAELGFSWSFGARTYNVIRTR
jgi:opacity protein-like surface antigen